MSSLSKNVWVLTISQAFMMSVGSLVVFAGGLVGSQIAPNQSLATLPVASIVIGSALSSVPVALSMKNFGRRHSFLGLTLLMVLVSLFAAYTIFIGSFYLMCLSFLLLGIGVSTVNQFRFAAMESVSKELMPKAASTVLLGGIASAFIGPEVAVFGKNLLATDFAGSFVLLSCLFVIGFALLLFYKNTTIAINSQVTEGRNLSEIAKQPIFWIAVSGAMIGYAVMSFIMTATPVSMHVMDGHALHHTKWVIQSHIVAMFLPSLFVSWIINKIGIFKLMITGIALFSICIIIALSGHFLYNYWVSLILLGIGWNFLFVGGTSLLPQSYNENERFKVQAMNELLVFGTQAVAALSAGYVVFALGWERMLLFTIPLLFIPLGAILYFRLKTKK